MFLDMRIRGRLLDAGEFTAAKKDFAVGCSCSFAVIKADKRLTVTSFVFFYSGYSKKILERCRPWKFLWVTTRQLLSYLAMSRLTCSN